MSNQAQFDKQIAAGLNGAFKKEKKIEQLQSIALTNEDALRYI